MLVSIIIPCGKVDQYFELALDSIINQTYRDIEVLVMANGLSSTELDELHSICSRDARVVVYKIDIKSLINALNMGIHYSSGEYIARMDCDDISFPARIEKQVDFLLKNTDHSVVGCRVALIDKNGKFLTKKFKYVENDADIRSCMPIRNVMCHPALMFKKSDLISVGGYKFGFMSEDHELFIRMLRAGMKFHNINENLFCYRRHEGQITSFDKAWKNFIEITSFLIMHGFTEKNPKYLLGIAVLFPPFRMAKMFLEKMFNKNK